MEARGRTGRMIVVVDASIAAAWLLPEKDSDAAEALIAALSGRPPIPSLFWHEARNILVMAERRGRIVAGEAAAAMGRLRRLPLEDAGAGSDGAVLALAMAHGLTAYDAAYLALAQERGLPLATLDQKLAQAARREGVTLLGPLEVRMIRGTARGSGQHCSFPHDAAPDTSPRRPISPLAHPRRGRERRSGAVARASDRLRQRAWKRLERLCASHGLSRRLARGADRGRRRAGRDFAGSGGDPLRRQRRDRAARLRPRLRRASPPRPDLRRRAVRAKRKLHHRRTRLLPASSRRSRPRRVRRDQRAGADDGRRREDARLLHESDRFRRAARQGAATAHRPGVQRDRVRRSSGITPSEARRCRRAGRSTRMAADHRSAARRCAERCSPSAARAAPISR